MATKRGGSPAQPKRAGTPRRTGPKSTGIPSPADDEAVVQGKASNGSRPEVVVNNVAVTTKWLRREVGRRGPLAGIFRQIDRLVHCPQEGEAGYIPLAPSDQDLPPQPDGPAQVRPVDAGYLQTRVQYTYDVVTKTKTGELSPAIFPLEAAKHPIRAVDLLPNVRDLRGVIHTPVVRIDGTVLSEPGYDKSTGLLYLPAPDLRVPAVAARPSAADLRDAVATLNRMLSGFPFVAKDSQANGYGALLTPLLRCLTPPPYKLFFLDAPMRGTGKSLLAKVLHRLYGGVFRIGLTEDDAELRKQITSFLSVTTGPVVVFDNVSGMVKSAVLDGLLTTDVWSDRPLGRTGAIQVPNDRLWIITGNNAALGGDTPRRASVVRMGAGVPEPEYRTGFDIPDLLGYVAEQRGEVIGALLTLVRSWVAAGRPAGSVTATSDDYARWRATVAGILGHAGIEGEFDSVASRGASTVGDEDWAEFLEAVWAVFGERAWTVKELLEKVVVGVGERVESGQKWVPVESLPDDLADRARSRGVASIARRLGWWCRNHRDRYAGGYRVREAGEGKVREWRVVPSDAE